MGEHLPCKQGVKSSNLSISIGGTAAAVYLENRIYEYPEITINVRDRKKTSEELPGEGSESKAM